MEEEMIDVELNLGKDLAGKLFKNTKKELIENMVVLILKTRVQEETIMELEGDADKKRILAAQKERYTSNEIGVLQTKLDKAESYVEQGRAMVNAVMQRWYEYDT